MGVIIPRVPHLCRVLCDRVGILTYPHPIGFLAHKERNRSHAGRNDTSLPRHSPIRSSTSFQRSRMRRQPPPSHRSRQTELIQPLRIVIRHPPRQHLPLPRIRRNLKPLQLLQDFHRPALARSLRSWSHMLPPQQPPQKLRRRNRLNLLPQHPHSQPMYASQKSPLTPLNLRFLRGICGDSRHRLSSRAMLDRIVWRGRSRPRTARASKRPTQDSPRRLHPQQPLLNIRTRKPEPIPKLRSSNRPNRRHPTHGKIQQRLIPRDLPCLHLSQTPLKPSPRKQRLKRLRPLRRYPIPPPIQRSNTRPPLIHKSFEEAPPISTARVGADAFVRPAEQSEASLTCHILRQPHQRMQHVMQLISIPHIRPSLTPYLRDRPRIQPAHFLQHRLRQHPPHLHRACPPFLERRVIEIRIRIRIQNFMRELRRHRSIHRQHTNLSRSHPAQHRLQSFNVHRLGEHIFHHFAHQRMIRNLPLPINILEARCCIRKHRGQQVIRPHPLNLRRNLLAILETQQRQRSVCIPPPARPKNRRIQRRLLQNRLHRIRIQKVKNVPQRKAVLLRQRNVEPVVGSRRLQLKIESHAEPFAQRQSPGFVDPPAKRRVDHQLHSAALIKESLRDNRLLRRHRAQHHPPLQDVLNRLLGARIIQPAFFLQPRHCYRDFRLSRRESHRRRPRQHLADHLPQLSHMLRQFLSPRRSLPAPEWHARRRSVRIVHQHPPVIRLNAMNDPRRIPQQHDVAAITLNCKILIDRADHRAILLSHNRVQRIVRNRPAAGDRRQPRPPPRPQSLIHPIAMNVRPIPPPARRNPLRQHLENRIKCFTRKIPI